MEIFRFIKWWWGRISRDDRRVIVVLFASVITAIIAWVVYLHWVASVSAFVVVFFAGIIAYGFFDVVSARWAMYANIKEREAEEIMRKLRNDK